MAKSDVEVRVRARNDECVRILKSLLVRLTQDQKSSVVVRSEPEQPDQLYTNTVDGDSMRIAVLYGAYHITDLISKFQRLGLQEIKDSRVSAASSNDGTSGRDRRHGRVELTPAEYTIWSVPIPGSISSVPSTINPTSTFRGFAPANFTDSLETFLDVDLKVSVVVAVFLIYLAIGALDWYALLRVLTDTFESLAEILRNQHIALDRVNANTISTVDTISLLPHRPTGFFDDVLDPVSSTAFGVFYVWAYGARHMSLLQSVSQFVVQWDKSLFEDILESTDDSGSVRR